MNRKDPYSTPARRRRIIAEVAKKTLRDYCIKACLNIAVLRRQTKAVVRMQCAFRAHLARKYVADLRFVKWYKASTKIQSALRRKLAYRRVKKLKADRHLRRQMRLAQVVNNLRNSRKNRMAWLAFLIAKKIAREKRQRKAATDIARVFRGHQALRIYHRMRQEHLAKIRRRNMAAVLIQSYMRRYLAKKSYLYWLTRRKAGWRIYKTVAKWWDRRKRLRFRRARTIQRYWRGCLGRIYAAKQRSERERIRELMRMRVSLLLQTLFLEEVTSELILQTAQSCLPEEHSMHIHVDVSQVLVQRMIAAGPRYVVEWCLDNSIVNYRTTRGYSAGAVVQQVVRSVDLALHASTSNVNSPTKNSTANTQTSTGEKVVALTSWDEETSTDKPHDAILPTNWSQTVFDSVPSSPIQHAQHRVEQSDSTNENLAHNIVPTGAGLSVDNVSHNSIHLHIATLQSDPLSQKYTRNIVTIVFNSPDDNIDDTDGTTDITSISQQPADLSEVKFRFKNVQVYLDNPAPVVPEIIKPEIHPPEVEIFEDSGSDEEEEVFVPIVQEVKVRPTTAVVRIVLREPTPPPPPIDFDAKAVILQMLLRRKYLHKTRFARRIQRFAQRSRIIFAWQEAVYSVLEIAHDAATIVQCWLRRAAAQRLLQRLKDEYERAHFVYGHDFTLSEKDNWAAFGLSMGSADDYYCEELCRRPVVQVSLQNRNANESEATQHKMRVLRLTRPPAAGEVLRLIEFPPAPPGCLFPPLHDSHGNPPSVFCMVDLSSRDCLQGLSEVNRAQSYSRDSFIQQLVVRNFTRDLTTIAPVPQEQPDSTSAVDNLRFSADVSAMKKINETEVLKWREEHLGDVLSDASVNLPADSFFYQEISINNAPNDLCNESMNRTAPIYARLARKFL